MRTSLLALLHQLEAEASTGRVAVRGVQTGWVYVNEGRIYCVERNGEPSLFEAMEAAGLFEPADLDLALRVPVLDRWRLLLRGDEHRITETRAFARRHATEHLRPLLAPVYDSTFVPKIEHPLGPLGSWTVDELLGEPTGGDGDVVDVAGGDQVIDARDAAPLHNGGASH
ncbi:MAG TPA: hypothetical protein VHN98_00850 [Acidimicrobiales bacterium]|nr:hypothetical protein [Acidimicrobiales bacterium]